MRKKRVWRYYCDFCKKAGCSGGHLKRHEERCTMNPNRFCGMCNMVDNEQIEITKMLEILPDPKECIVDNEYGYSYQGLAEIIDDALPKLRELVGNCPACILSALRQKGIPVPCVQGFNFTDECKAIWADINEANAEADCGYGYY